MRETMACDEISLELKSALKVEDIIDILTEQYPSVARFKKILTYAVNGEYADKRTILSDGDELALLPPISGGSDD